MIFQDSGIKRPTSGPFAHPGIYSTTIKLYGHVLKALDELSFY